MGKVLATVKFYDVSGSPEIVVEVESMRALGEAQRLALIALRSGSFGVIQGAGRSEVIKMERVS